MSPSTSYLQHECFSQVPFSVVYLLPSITWLILPPLHHRLDLSPPSVLFDSPTRPLVGPFFFLFKFFSCRFRLSDQSSHPRSTCFLVIPQAPQVRALDSPSFLDGALLFSLWYGIMRIPRFVVDPPLLKAECLPA